MLNARRLPGIRLTVFLAVVAGTICALSALSAAASATECPNEALRGGASASLPDCRAYEQVTPVDKGGQDAPLMPSGIFAPLGTPQAALNGDAAAYASFGAFPGSPASNPYYLASRGATTGWSSAAIMPPQSTARTFICLPSYEAYSPELARAVLADGQGQQYGCGADDPPLVSGEPQGAQNLFLRDMSTGTYHLINVTPSGVTPADASLEGGSTDLTHVVFSESAPLTPDAPSSGSGLYEWTNDTVSALGLIPTAPETSCSGASCMPVSNATLGDREQNNVANAISADGSHVFFEAGGDLYMRQGNTTTQLDATHGPGESGGGRFMAAASDGSSVVFTDTSRLTADSTASGILAGNRGDLYRYDTSTGTLTDLTVDTSDAGGAEVQGLMGASEDGSYLYVVAKGVLTSTPNLQGESATAGQANVYLLHEGIRTFIAALAPNASFSDPGDSADWLAHQPTEIGGARVTPDGIHLAFVSERSLTGYDNMVASGSSCGQDGYGNALPSNCKEVFVYDAKSDTLVCASCNPSGARPVGPSFITGQKLAGNETHASNFSLTRALSGDGTRLFFESLDALARRDTNGKYDVYEWEAAGTGGCAVSPADSNGCVYLISAGSGADDSWFFEASANGNDVFFTSREQLVGQDDDGLRDLYDARVNGGLAIQNPLPASRCSGEECRLALNAAALSPPAASVTFVGPGNLTHAQGGKHVHKGAKAKRHRQLEHALRRCKARFRHDRHKRRRCRRRARRRLRDSHVSSTARDRHRHRHARRFHGHVRGGAR